MFQRLFACDNRIARYERDYQQRMAQKASRAWRIARWPLVGLSLIIYGGFFASALFQRDPFVFVDRLGLWPLLLVIVTAGRYFTLLVQTLIRAANSIGREKEAGTWELLQITYVDARFLVCSKWWATVQAQWRDYVWLAVLMWGAFTWIALTQSVPYIYGSTRSCVNNVATGLSGCTELRLSFPSPFTIIMSGSVIFGLALVNLVLTAACGVLSAVSSRESGVSLTRAVVLRLTLGILPTLALTVLVPRFEYAFLAMESQRQAADMITVGGYTLLDNGVMLTLYGLLRLDFKLWLPVGAHGTTMESVSLPFGFVLLGVVVGLTLYALLTWYMLRLAARRVGEP